MKIIHGEKVYGSKVDAQTGCAHYRSPADIIAVKFKCCEKWFPCFECHAEIADHKPAVWAREEFENPAVLCGCCGYRLTVSEYFECDSVCPKCSSQFNPGCAKHYHLYFETSRAEK